MSKVNKMLEKLSGGEKGTTDLLSDRKAELLEAYDRAEDVVKHRQAELEVQMPFVEALKKKVSKLIDTVDTNVPVVTRYDLYTGIRKLSERSAGDNGLKKLAKNLERVWQSDPLGTLSHAEVDGLIKLYADTHPRSKAADAIEAECSRVGLHKLPVAKLAKIASQINTQEDYESLMEVNGFAGNRVEQIRARSLVRGLVSMRGNTVVSTENDAKDERTTDERVADRIAQMAAPMPEDPMLEDPMAADPAMDMPADPMGAPADMGAEPQPEQLGQTQDLIQQVEEGVQEVLDSGEYVDLQPYFEHELGEGHTAPVGTAAWGAEEILNEGHEAVPGTPEWIMEEEQELAGQPPAGGAGMDIPAAEPMPMEPMMASKEAQKKGKGIPLPAEKPKAQPKVTTYAPKPASGGAAIKAKVEDEILDGNVVKAGSVSIKIGKNDTVELWTKEGGRECDLVNIDVAINDFIKLATEEKRRLDIFKTLTFAANKIVEVPCEKCANVTFFKAAKKLSDVYQCDCGFQISAESTLEAHKALGKLPSYGVDIQYRVASKEQFEEKRSLLHKAVLTAANGNPVGIVADDVGRFNFVIDNVDSKFIDVLVSEFGKNFAPVRVAEIPRPLPGAPGAEAIPTMPGGSKMPASPINPATGAPSVKDTRFPAPRAKGVQPGPLNPLTKAPTVRGIDMPAPKPKLGQVSPSPMAPPSGVPNTSGIDTNLVDRITAALTNYRNLGMNLMDAITTMKKEHGEFLPENGEGMDSALIELAGKLWGAVPNGISEPSMDMMPQAEPMSMGMMPEQALPSMDMMPDPAAMPMAAARKQAEGGMKVPSIRKPKDKVKVDKDLGKDTEGDNLPNLPKSFKPSQGKPDGKLSKTDLGKDSEGKDLLPHPEGKPSATHSPKSQSGVSLPNPDLGSDSEPNDAFSVPGQGAKPSVKHKQ